MTSQGSAFDLTIAQIFLDSGSVVQVIIVLLLAASVFSWSQIICRSVALAIERKRTKSVREVLNSIETLEALRDLTDHGDGRVHRVLRAMAREWTWSSENAVREYALIRQRLASVSDLAIEREYNRIAGRTAWLATIGNTAPFIGLFGTVWGIMTSFIAISQTQETSLAVVAPGMAEALLATAVGLFCAIPASVGYNRIVQGLAQIEQEWRSIAGQLEVAISRQHNEVR